METQVRPARRHGVRPTARGNRPRTGYKNVRVVVSVYALPSRDATAAPTCLPGRAMALKDPDRVIVGAGSESGGEIGQSVSRIVSDRL